MTHEDPDRRLRLPLGARSAGKLGCESVPSLARGLSRQGVVGLVGLAFCLACSGQAWVDEPPPEVEMEVNPVNVNLLESVRAHDVDGLVAALDAGADIDARLDGFGTALLIASLDGHVPTVVALLEAGANLEIPGGTRGTTSIAYPGGSTPLIYAAELGHDPIVAILVEAGARLETRSRNFPGVTAFAAAVVAGQQGTAAQLLAFGADIDSADGLGMTSLMYAARAGDLPLTQWLVQMGADVTAQDRDARRALFYSANSEIRSFLRESQ